MPTKGRYLRGNKGNEGPTNLLFFDTESHSLPVQETKNKTRLTLRLWCAISCRLERGEVTRRKTHTGKTATEFWNMIQSINRDNSSLWCFSHNIGHDLTQLGFWDELDNERFTIRPVERATPNPHGGKRHSGSGRLVLDGPPTYIVCRDKRTTYKFIDTCNYWRSSLHSIGENIGLGKRESPQQTDTDDNWQEYCHRDCQVIEYAVVSVLERWLHENCGVFQMTGPSLAMTNFRHTCGIRTDDGDSLDIVCEPNARQHDLERDAYFGGRTICYFVGTAKGQVFHLDCNSLYPYVMRNKSYPRRFVRYQEGMSIDDLQSAMRVYGVVARVSIQSRDSTFPVRVDGKQYHCTGNYWASLCGPELQRAIDTKSIHRIGTVQLYSVAPLFAKWVDYWYDRKVRAIREGHRGLAELEFVKLILNSLSGKWAQRGRNWIDRPDVIPRQRWGGWVVHDRKTDTYERWRAIAGNAQRLSEESEPLHAFPAISSFITAFAREYMRQVIDTCPPNSVYYSATDSIICDSRAFLALESLGYISQFGLGKFKVCGKYTECEIHGPNHYRLDGKEIATGSLGKYIGGKGTSGRVDIWERLPSLIADGPRSDTILTSVPIVPIKPDHRGHVNRAGWWEPYRLTMDPDFSDRPPSAVDLPEYLTDTREGRTPVDA